MKPTKVTMADVARRANVSAATVARAIYNNGYVKKDTREAVEAAVAATGYRPNMVARSLRTNRSYTLGLVVNASRLNVFHTAIAQVIQQEALRQGYTVLTLNNHTDPDIESRGVRRFLDHHVDAVIFSTAVDPANVRFIAKNGVPTVQVERQNARVGSLVAVDAEKGMQAAIDHLFELGHRRFAYIGGDVQQDLKSGSTGSAIETTREQLFREGLGRRGIEVTDDHVKMVRYHDIGKPHHQPGYYAMGELLALDPRPTAVICGSDLLAAPALQAMNKAGLSIPDDISIIGYDDSFAEILTPPLSSIAQPVEEMGKLAVELAIRAIDNPGKARQTARTRTQLVLRESTGRAPTP